MILQIIITIFALFAISRSYIRFRNNQESLYEFIFWILVWVGIVIVVLRPGLTDIFGKFVGIERGIDALVYLSIVVIFYLVYRIYAIIEKIERNITKVTREIAINSNQSIKKLKKGNDK